MLECWNAKDVRWLLEWSTTMEPWVPVLYEQPTFGVAEWISLASGLGGALLGAGIGAAVSWFLQRQANNIALRRDEEGRNANRQAQLFNALTRLTYVLACSASAPVSQKWVCDLRRVLVSSE
jgi:hypothetical protein